MSTSTTTVTVTDTWYDGQRQHVLGNILINAGDYAAGGLVVNFQDPKIKSTLVPDNSAVQIWGAAGFIYVYVAGTTIANGKMEVWVSTASATTNDPLTQYSTTASSAGLIADVTRFHAIFKALR
jgi:hypothetical protein